MANIKRFFKSKLFIFLVIFAVIIAIGVAVFFMTREDHKRVNYLGGDVSQRRVSEYKSSYLDIHKNGTFVIKIVYNEKGDAEPITEFIGIGTYAKSGKNYTFTYVDMFSISPDGQIMRDDRLLQDDNATAIETYYSKKKGIEIYIPGTNKLFRFK